MDTRDTLLRTGRTRMLNGMIDALSTLDEQRHADWRNVAVVDEPFDARADGAAV
jgi:hypothetical protein